MIKAEGYIPAKRSKPLFIRPIKIKKNAVLFSKTKKNFTYHFNDCRAIKTSLSKSYKFTVFESGLARAPEIMRHVIGSFKETVIPNLGCYGRKCVECGLVYSF